MKIKLPVVCSFLIVMFHLVGLTGFLVPSTISVFLKLVPFHLLLMVFLLIVSHRDKSNSFWFFVAVTYLLGVIVEMVGTNTGIIFGEYTYGSTLGYKLSGTPLLIGVNWVILIYSIGTMLSMLSKSRTVIKCLGGATIMVFLDILIEPVAIAFDYWTWTGGMIPLQNYVAWFVFSFVLFLLFYRMNFEKKNSAAIIMVLTQTVFFIVLNIAVS